VAEQVRVGAAGVFEGVGEQGQAYGVEAAGGQRTLVIRIRR
jgi:hypothetical protein